MHRGFPLFALLALCLTAFAQGGQVELFTHTLLAPDKPARTKVAPADVKLPAADSGVLALWCQPTPDTLWYWVAPPFGSGKPVRITRRAFTLDGMNLGPGQAPTLAALFPYTPDPTSFEAPPPPGTNISPEYGYRLEYHPVLTELPLRTRQGTGVPLWPGRNIVLEETGLYYKQILGFLPLPNDGAATAAFPQLAERQQPPRQTRPPDRPVKLVYPDADYAALKAQGAGAVDFKYDVETRGWSFFSPGIFTERGGTPMLPAAATKLTVGWLGVGSIRNVPLPPAPATVDLRAPAPTVTLPAWDPGPVVSGTVLKPDGTPFAGEIRVAAAITPGRNPHSSQLLKVKTGDDGRFTVKGVLPGPLLILPVAGDPTCWVREVPEAGLQNLTLKMAAKPLQLRLAMTQYSAPAYWWLPDGGTPRQLYTGNTHDLPDGPGYVWAHDGGMGVAQYLRYTPQTGLAGAGYLAGMGDPPYGKHPLALYLPADGPMLLGETTVTLTGLGNRAGLTARFNYIAWRAASLIGANYAKIADVPPGEWRVELECQRGRATATVKIGDAGGWVLLKPAP